MDMGYGYGNSKYIRIKYLSSIHHNYSNFPPPTGVLRPRRNSAPESRRRLHPGDQYHSVAPARSAERESVGVGAHVERSHKVSPTFYVPAIFVLREDQWLVQTRVSLNWKSDWLVFRIMFEMLVN